VSVVPRPTPVVAVAHSCVVTWFQSVRGTLPHDAWRWQLDLNRTGLRSADLVLAPSRSFADLLTGCYGELPHLRVVYNAARPIRSETTKQPFIIAAGRWWDAGKNLATLDAAASGSPLPVRLAGPLKSPTGQTTTVANAEPLGELPHPDLCQLIGRASIFCSPSIYEPFGLAALEAATAGAALVLSDIPTYRELWDGAALFAAPRDPTSFSGAFWRLASDRDLRSELGVRASVRAARFTLAAQAAAIRDAYSEAIARHRRSQRLTA